MAGSNWSHVKSIHLVAGNWISSCEAGKPGTCEMPLTATTEENMKILIVFGFASLPLPDFIFVTTLSTINLEI